MIIVKESLIGDKKEQKGKRNSELRDELICMEREKYDMGRDENRQVFQDTEKQCKTNEILKQAVKNSTQNQKLILETDEVPEQNRDRYDAPARVVVSKKRSFEAAKGYKGNKVVVHNFASATSPGGGVVNGATAQEECLCRCSGLYFSLNNPDMWNGFYTPHRNERNPIHNADIIYTPDVTVFKTDTSYPKMMSQENWYNVDVITCAAPNLREKPSNKYNANDGDKQIKVTDKELLAIHEKRLKRMLEVSISMGADTIILGAFGCGAFANNPEIVAKANKSIIQEYLHAFKNIEFAIYCTPRDERNYKIFERHLT